jgi:hypothetical protein
MERRARGKSANQVLVSRKAKWFLSILIVAIIIGLSFIFGYIAAELKVSPIVNSMNQDQANLESLILTASINSNSSVYCPLVQAGLGTISQELSDIYSELSGAKSGYPLPAQYASIGVQLAYLRLNYWILSNKMYSECGHSIETALMFYPNSVCITCGEEGQELAVVSQESNYTLLPTVIETGLNISEVYALQKVFNITTYPTLVIDGKYIIKGYLTTSQIIQDACKYMPNMSICNS